MDFQKSFNFQYFSFILIFIILHLNIILSQINDNYETDVLENGAYDILEVVDHNNLKLIVSTSKNIYIGIPPTLKTTTDAELINATAIITLNEDYLLAACLNDSLLTKISLEDGTFSRILDYSEVDSSLTMDIPITSCSLSILNNFVFIGYSEVNYFEQEINNETMIEINKTNIIIKLTIENLNTDNPYIIEKTFFKFPISTILTESSRQIACEPLRILNDDNNFRLVCIHETCQYAEDNKMWRFYTYSTSINENFNGFEISMDENRIYRVNEYSGFRIFKLNDYYARVIMKKIIYDIHLELVEGKVNIRKNEANKNISSISAAPDLFFYNNNMVFYVENNNKNPINIKIAKESSNNYFWLYDNNNERIKNILGYYDDINDYTLLTIQSVQNNCIKYFTLKNNNKIFNIGEYFDIIRIKTNETAEYNIMNLFDFSEYGQLEIDTITTYKSDKDKTSSQKYGKDTHYLLNTDNNNMITMEEESLNHWKVYTFLLIDYVDNKFVRLYYLKNMNLTVRTCAYQCGSCGEDYYKCDECRSETYILFKFNDDEEEKCYPTSQLFKGYIYNSENQEFSRCYESCSFCTEISNEETEHKCEECSDNYFPSYVNLGNCYSLEDFHFNSDSCSKYIINSTGECVDECPSTEFYYHYEYNFINFTEQTFETLKEKQYIKNKIKPPKYLFNNICYDICPLYSQKNDISNICDCKFAFHKTENNEIICHPGLYCINEGNKYRYYIEDTKECISDGCPSNYYQFNFICYKDGCPNNTNPSETNSYKCISEYSFCYINDIFENICNETKNESYIYKFEDTKQYLRSCGEAEIYTINSNKAYLFNNICYSICPTNTEINDEQNHCVCKNYGYYPNDGDIICYSEIEKCGDNKIPVIDIKKCINDLQICRDNNYKIFNNECYSTICPSNSKIDENGDENTCICSFLFYNEGNLLHCFEESITECPSEIYEYYNSESKECFLSLQDCFDKNNNYFFNKNCYKTDCPNDLIKLNTKSSEIKNYYKNNLLSDNDDLIDKLCICNVENKVWTNITLNNQLYYQECLSECEIDFEPEIISKQCIQKIIPTTIIKDHIEYIENNNKKNCKAIYNNKCYEHCPDGTCLTQDDPSLVNCIPFDSNVRVFNNICFSNFEQITQNIKSLSENDDIISTESGIIIKGYSINSENNANIDTKYSLIDLGDCENKIREYYNLDDNTELFILGIDSPNKDSSASTSVYNYGVYLDNGTLLDHSLACKGTKISISSAIVDTDLVKLEDASYFNDQGYDIYNENSDFYTDNCASASIDGNDITLADRKTDFFPANISLCNESCHYSHVDLETKRFTCECETGYNFSESYSGEEEINEEDDSNYLEYFLSLINYKIGVCYKLFYDFKSYYYNAGFYISVGIFFFCILSMFVFIFSGIKSMNKLINQNIPSKFKLREAMKEQLKKRKELLEKKNENDPPLRRNIKDGLKQKQGNDSRESFKTQSKTNKNILKKKSKFQTEGANIKLKSPKKIMSNKSKQKDKTTKKGKRLISTVTVKSNLKYQNETSVPKTSKKMNFFYETEAKQSLKETEKNKNLGKKNLNSKYKNVNRKIIKDEYGLISYINDEEVDKKELNIIPYTQALRIDKRSYIEMLLSVIYNEIDIINIFYYKSPFSHLSLVISIYAFELYLDLTLNCLLYTDDVVSEKYNNNGSIQFFTSLSLSFMSNIFASIIAFIIGKLAEYDAVLEMIIKSAIKQKEYFMNIIKFKKYISFKLTGFFIIQGIINLGMCYYLLIFCTIYHNTQGSIMINYIVGIAESLGISFGLSILISLIRYLSLKYKKKSLYYTSKYLFEHF